MLSFYMNMSTPANINQDVDRSKYYDPNSTLTEAQKKSLGKRMKVRARNKPREIHRDK